MSRPLFTYLLSAGLAVVAHIWMVDIAARANAFFAGIDLRNLDLDNIVDLSKVAIELYGAMAAVVATVIVAIVAFYFMLKRAYDHIWPPGPDRSGPSLLSRVVTVFVPVYGLLEPLRRFRTTERLLLGWSGAEPASAPLGQRILLAAVAAFFQVYVLLLALLYFWPGKTSDENAWDVPVLQQWFLIGASALAFICAALGAAYLIPVDRNYRRMRRDGRNSITEAFE